MLSPSRSSTAAWLMSRARLRPRATVHATVAGVAATRPARWRPVAAAARLLQHALRWRAQADAAGGAVAVRAVQTVRQCEQKMASKMQFLK